MIHPDTELKYIDEIVGYGVFATAKIPEGTIVYVKDSLEIVVSPTEYLSHVPEVREAIDKYSYIDEKGDRIVSWDFAKYVNHCCNYNTISTGYGFEIAIRDIEKGEQITDEYGIFNLEKEMSCLCQDLTCRQKIKPDDFDNYYHQWDYKIFKSLLKLFTVNQPLIAFLESEIKQELNHFISNHNSYKSVYALKHQRDQKLHFDLLLADSVLAEKPNFSLKLTTLLSPQKE